MERKPVKGDEEEPNVQVPTTSFDLASPGFGFPESDEPGLLKLLNRLSYRMEWSRRCVDVAQKAACSRRDGGCRLNTFEQSASLHHSQIRDMNIRDGRRYIPCCSIQLITKREMEKCVANRGRALWWVPGATRREGRGEQGRRCGKRSVERHVLLRSFEGRHQATL